MSHRNLFAAAPSGLVIAVLVAGASPQRRLESAARREVLDDRRRDWFAWPVLSRTVPACVPACRTLSRQCSGSSWINAAAMCENGPAESAVQQCQSRPARCKRQDDFAAMLLPNDDQRYVPR
jgi:hypothetical protein